MIVLEVEDRPGALGEVARKLGKANINLTTVYLATNTRLVLGRTTWPRRKRRSADQRLNQPWTVARSRV